MMHVVQARDLADLREAARRAVEANASLAARASGDGSALDYTAWRRSIATMGWYGLGVAEEYGGAGRQFAPMVVVLAELGRQLAPSGLIGSTVLAAEAIYLAGSEEQRLDLLPRIVSGELPATVALTGANGSPDPAELTAAIAGPDSDLRLRGSAGYLLDGEAVDLIVVAARDGDDISMIMLDSPTSTTGVHLDRVETPDVTRSLWRLRFDDVRVGAHQLLGGRAGGGEVLTALLDRAGVAIGAESLGGAERVLELTSNHCIARTQFGRPIGSFQAVKHHLVNMLIAVETTRVAVGAAADAVSRADPDEWVRIVKAHAGDAYVEAAGMAVQLHGGIGFTWEALPHHYLKRARVNQQLVGGPSWQRRRLYDLVTSRNGLRS